MIIDNVKNLAFYTALNSRFAQVANYLSTTDLDSLSEGKFEIDGQRIHVSIMERELKTKENAPLEAHDRYIDIQIVLRGEESFGWSARSTCHAPRGAMDTTKDIVFFDNEPQTWFTLQPGAMAIFFPNDAHAPMVGGGKIKKAVIKVLV